MTTLMHPDTANPETLVDRLRGIYRIPIRDGLGPVGAGDEPDNPHEYVRSGFQTPPIQHAAAAEIERLRAEVAALRLTLGGSPPAGQSVPEPIGCPCPGACMTVAEVERLRAEVARLREALTECAMSLEEEINARYGMTAGQVALHPIEQRRYLRDMDDVRRARAALSGEARDD